MSNDFESYRLLFEERFEVLGAGITELRHGQARIERAIEARLNAVEMAVAVIRAKALLLGTLAGLVATMAVEFFMKR